MKNVGRGAAPKGPAKPVVKHLEKFPPDDQLPKTPAELKAALRYQFTSALFDESYPSGWFPVFARLCYDIDSLDAEDLGFRWVQLKEKFGTARWYGRFILDSAVYGRDERRVKIANAVREAAERTGSTCMVCGEPGELDQSQGWMLTLCEEHAHERAQNGGAY